MDHPKPSNMTAINHIKGVVDIERLPVNSEELDFDKWKVNYTKSHILHSICTTPDLCKTNPQEQCLLCRYTNFVDLPHLPEMVFAKNNLKLTHPSGVTIEFNALDALRQVCNGKLPLQVACSEEWKESRNPALVELKVKPFDWTFSTDYKGTLEATTKVEATEERIDIERLKVKEKILFYEDLMLYEDELHDNGISSCTLKIRVMPTSFFILLRFFLRVDNVMVRINDTRFFHDFGKDYVLREFSNKECGVKELNLPLNMFGDPNLLSPHVPLRSFSYEKIVLPTDDTNEAGKSTANLP